MSLFEVKNLSKIYGGGVLNKDHNVALDDFSFAISGEQPQITTIAGESGSGKTTLANLVLGFLTPTSGEVLYRGKDIWKMSRREHISVLREGEALFPRPYWKQNTLHKQGTLCKKGIIKIKTPHSKNTNNK